MKIFLITTSIFFSSGSYATVNSTKSYCDKLKVGESFQLDKEQKALASNGFKTEIAIAGEAGHDTKMLMISRAESKEKCNIVIRDGKIHEVRR